MDYSNQEIVADSISVVGANCNGCKRWERDIMITFMSSKDKHTRQFNDVFLTQSQAVDLLKQLSQQINFNWEHIPVDRRREVIMNLIFEN